MTVDPIDLVAPVRFMAPVRTSFLDKGQGVSPRYVPGPLADGMVRVVLSWAGADGEPADFEPYETYWTIPERYRVFDIPREQYERWEAAKAAFTAMTEEIDASLSARSAEIATRAAR